MEIRKTVNGEPGQHVDERHYWSDKLSGEWVKSTFPYDHPKKNGTRVLTSTRFCLEGEGFSALMKLSNKSYHRLFMILLAQLVVLLYKYTANTDIIVGMPIYQQEKQGKFINTVLALRNTFPGGISFKELLSLVRQTVIDAVKHQNHPVEALIRELKPSLPGDDFPLFDMAILLENIHDKDYIKSINTDMLFRFRDSGELVEGLVEYNASLYTASTVEGIIAYYRHLVRHMLNTPEVPLRDIEILGEEEKKQLLFDFNDTASDYETHNTLQQLFENQVERSSDRTALIGQIPRLKSQAPNQEAALDETVFITYRELNLKSNRLAHLLRAKGVKPGAIVGVLLESSIRRIVGIMAILKAGGAYLPLDPEFPENRVLSILKDCRLWLLLTDIVDPEKYSFSRITNLHLSLVEPFKTGVRPQITDFDALPFPDRGLVDYGKYRSCMGHAVVTGSVSIQATRGCPYNCAYCHKIWPRRHIFRAAENLFTEVRRYYRQGVRNFSFVDDIFNLNAANSRKFYGLIIANRMRDIRFFFPNGLRGDILTRDYIDLMVEAGVKSIALALETGSPRLQQMLGKRLDLEKFHANLEYISQKYPQIFLELFTMLGFPTETEEEAMMTYNFIKSIKWIHFPYVFILKIFPNTDMARLAIENGIPGEAITRSANLAFHQLPETLPFPRSFVLQYQARFTNEYLMSKERLLHVLPFQVKLCTENELVKKYQNSLPITVKHFPDILRFFGISAGELQNIEPLQEDNVEIPGFYKKKPIIPPVENTGDEPLRILLLDLSLAFTSEQEMMLHLQVTEPLGLMYLMTYLNEKFGNRVTGIVLKSRVDFDSHEELMDILHRFQPDLIGIRTLSYYKEFFHRIISYIRHLGITVPIVSGGPYATSDYKFILQDRHLDLVVLGEGEITFAELVEKIMENQKQLPDEETLKSINGIAFVEKKDKALLMREAREVIFPDRLSGELARCPVENPTNLNRPQDLLYLVATSGSTGKPKSVMLEHRNLANLLYFQFNRTNIDFRQRVLQFASIGFDVSAQEIFSTLLAGGELYLIDSEMKTDVYRLFDGIEKNDIGILFLPPAFLKLVFSRTEYTRAFPKTVKHIIAAGEQLVVPGPLKNLVKQNRVVLHNHYGPSETHVVTTLTVDPAGEVPDLPSLGKPIANTRIYILDDNLHPLPIGVTGQLYIGGANLGRGYLNNPELTFERFCLRRPGGRFLKKLPPWTPRKNFLLYRSLLYHTGDLARWLPDGTIEFKGRTDSQVKIRGYRIETGEIEKHLLEIDFIKEAVVLDRVSNKDLAGSERYLCAYFVSAKKSEASQLRNLLSGSLPGYMIPTYFVQLEKIPLTSNGKVNRNLLPDPGVSSEREYTAPRNALEEKLAALWSEILEIDENRPGIDDNFFDLGGQSLKAAVLISELHKVFAVKTSLAEIFDRPTIRGLASLIEHSRKDKFKSIDAVEKREYYPLSPAQQRLYVQQEMTAENTAYNLSLFAVMEGEPDKTKPQEVFNKLIRRHEAFRTSFQVTDKETVQKVHDDVEFNIEYYDLDTGEDESKRGSREVRKIGREDELTDAFPESQELRTKRCISYFIRPFDLSGAPLLRVGLIKITEDQHLFMVDLHHIITDAASLAVMTTEFMKLYNRENLPRLRLRYTDFSLWQHQRLHAGEIKTQEQYWLNQFRETSPSLNLPTDFSRPAARSFLGERVSLEIDAKFTLEIRQLISGTGSTLFMLFLAVFNILLSKYTGQEDIVVGMVAEGRPHADLQSLIGMFVNTLALRNRPVGEKTGRVFLNDVKKNVFKAHENQDYPFEELVRKLGLEGQINRNPLFDVIFPVTTRETTGYEIPGLKLRPYKDNTPLGSRFDLSVSALESVETIHLSVIFSPGLFESPTVEKLLRRFLLILRQMVSAVDVKIADLDLLTAEEKRTLIVDFNNTHREYAGDKTTAQLFAEQVSRVPDRVAVMDEEGQISYRELSRRAHCLARVLRARLVKPDDIIALREERSPAMIVGIMAVLKAGAAYLPLDPDTPKKRRDSILEDAGVSILLTKKRQLNDDLANASREAIAIDELTGPPYYRSAEDLEPVNRADDLAYVLFTSGSTGKPKGVMIRHRNINNLVMALEQCIYRDWGDGLRVAQVAPYIFDASVKQIFAALLQGHTLVIVPGETRIDSRLLLDFFEKYRIDVTDGTPIHIKSMLEITREQQKIGGVKPVTGVKHFIIGGEPLTVQTAQDFIKGFAGIPPKVTNIYGVTECTVDSTYFEITAENFPAHGFNDTLPLGRPLPNSYVYILNRENRLQPVGIPGELIIGGAGVGRGYLNNPELTAEKFVTGFHRFARFYRSYTSDNSYIYRTGDLARWVKDGNIEFLGRMDFQVKIRGYRIEAGEIENRLRRNSKIKDAVVTIKQDITGDNYLCAYIEAASSLQTADLREYLLQDLPVYMIPRYVVMLEKIPFDQRGKVDRGALPEPRRRIGDTGDYAAPGDELEEKLVRLWSELLDLEKSNLSIDANFFELGGHSLKAAILIARIHKALNIAVTLTEMFGTPTVRGLARLMRKKREKENRTIYPDRHRSIPLVEKKEYYPLSPALTRLYFEQQMNPGSIHYNMIMAAWLEGDLDSKRMEKAFKEMVCRHETLRTAFVMVNDEPVQKISAHVEFEIEYFNLATENTESTKKKTGDHHSSFILHHFLSPFDLARAPLFRAGLLKTGEKRHIIVVKVHHLTADGTSLGLIRKEFMALYGDEKLPPLPVRFTDYSQWKNRGPQQTLRKKQENFWLAQFNGGSPTLNLPYDNPRPPLKSYEGTVIYSAIRAEETQKLRSMALKEDVSLYMLILALFNILLMKLSGQQDIVVGTPMAGRNHADLEPLIGMFVNTLALRNYPTAAKPFKGFLKEVKERTLLAFANQEYELEALVRQVVVERDTGRSPLFDVFFALQNMEMPEVVIPGLRLRPYEFDKNISRFDMSFQVFAVDSHLEVGVEYCTGLFKKETVERFMENFKEIIAAVLENPDISLNDVKISTEAREAKIKKPQLELGF